MAEQTKTPSKSAKKTAPPAETVELVAEVIPQDLTAEQEAELVVSKFDLPLAWINDRKERYADLTIANKEDKEGHAAVKAAWQEVRNKRLAVQNKHKEVKARYLVITRAIDGIKNQFVPLLEAIENPLKDKLDQFEEWKLEEQREAERLEKLKLDGRIDELKANGMQFNGEYYVIGDTISLDVVTVKNLDDEKYGQLLDRVKAENARIVAEREAEEARKKKEREDFEEAQRKQEEQRKQLEQQQADLKRQQEELQANLKRQQDELEAQRKKIRDERTAARGAALEALGMSFNYSSNVFQFGTFDFGRVYMSKTQMEEMEGGWETTLKNFTEQINDMKAKQAEKDAERKREEDARKEQEEADRKKKEALDQRFKARQFRLAQLFGMEYENGYFIRHGKFDETDDVQMSGQEVYDAENGKYEAILEVLTQQVNEVIKEENAFEAKQKAEQEAARVASLSDVQKIEEWVVIIEKYIDPTPVVTNPKIRGYVDSAFYAMLKSIEDLRAALADFK